MEVGFHEVSGKTSFQAVDIGQEAGM